MCSSSNLLNSCAIAGLWRRRALPGVRAGVGGEGRGWCFSWYYLRLALSLSFAPFPVISFQTPSWCKHRQSLSRLLLKHSSTFVKFNMLKIFRCFLPHTDQSTFLKESAWFWCHSHSFLFIFVYSILLIYKHCLSILACHHVLYLWFFLTCHLALQLLSWLSVPRVSDRLCCTRERRSGAQVRYAGRVHRSVRCEVQVT